MGGPGRFVITECALSIGGWCRISEITSHRFAGILADMEDAFSAS